MTTTVHVISHTHWDREWYLTFEQYRARLVDLVDCVLDRMSTDPRFTFFHLDGQSIVLEDYLEIRPEREAEIRRRVAEGRLLAGPWYVMPDMFLVSGEAMVRNLARGLRVATGFGQAMRVGYIPDPFGHIAQMPQILAGFGLEGAILWRGFGGKGAEYAWEAPDGTRVLLMHLPPEGYCNGVRLPLAAESDMPREAAAVVGFERARSRSGQVLLMVGVDHVEPHPRLMPLVDTIDEMPDTSARLSTLPAFVKAVAGATKLDDLEVIRGELRGGQDYAHLLPGVFSARTYLKQWNARDQRELEQWAEPASAFAMLAGAPVVQGTLDYAWRTLLQNHPHDSICGCSIDAVHEENVTRFARVDQATATVTERAFRAIASRVGPPPTGAIRALAVNISMTPWAGVVEATIDIPTEVMTGFRDVDIASVDDPIAFFGDGARITSIVDHAGTDVPFQVLGAEDAVSFRTSRYAPPVGIHVRRVRLAMDVSAPALGFAAVDVCVGSKTGAPAASASGSVRSEDDAIENDLVRVQARPDGAFDVLDKRTDTRYEGVFAIDDVGDVGDEYNYAPPRADVRVTNGDARDQRVELLESGPLAAALKVSYTVTLPAMAAVDRQSRSPEHVDLPVSLEVRVRAGSSAIECRARVENRARDHRLRVLCPTGASTAPTHRADTAFAVVQRVSAAPVLKGPLAETPVAPGPMQSFVDAGGDSVGATVVTDGLVEYEVCRPDADPTIAVTLLRAVGDLSRDDLSTRKGHAGPGLSTPGAQCLGTHDFRLAFIPRGAPPAAGDLYASARAFLSPPRLVPISGGDGTLPASHSFFQIDADPSGTIVLSACKVADDRPSVILRLFNLLDVARRLQLSIPESIEGVYLADLAERRTARCVTAHGEASVTLGPHRIQTIELSMGGTHA